MTPCAALPPPGFFVGVFSFWPPDARGPKPGKLDEAPAPPPAGGGVREGSAVHHASVRVRSEHRPAFKHTLHAGSTCSMVRACLRAGPSSAQLTAVRSACVGSQPLALACKQMSKMLSESSRCTGEQCAGVLGVLGGRSTTALLLPCCCLHSLLKAGVLVPTILIYLQKTRLVKQLHQCSVGPQHRSQHGGAAPGEERRNKRYKMSSQETRRQNREVWPNTSTLPEVWFLLSYPGRFLKLQESSKSFNPTTPGT